MNNRHNVITRILRNQENEAGTVAAEAAAPVLMQKDITVTFNASYEKDEKGNTKIVKVQGPDNTTIEQKVIKTPAKAITAKISAPRFEDLTPDILVSLYNDRLEKMANTYVKSEDKTKLTNGAVFEYTFTPADLLNVSVDIPDELVEKAQTAFMEYLAKQGKTEKAQKNNAAFLVMGWKKIQMQNADFVSAYSNNLLKFIENASAELLGEIEPVLSRANKNLEDSKNASLSDLI